MSVVISQREIPNKNGDIHGFILQPRYKKQWLYSTTIETFLTHLAGFCLFYYAERIEYVLIVLSVSEILKKANTATILLRDQCW